MISTALVPFFACQSSRVRKAPKSTLPSALKGVIRATKLPSMRGLAMLDPLSNGCFKHTIETTPKQQVYQRLPWPSPAAPSAPRPPTRTRARASLPPEVFVRRGIEAATIREITDAASVNVAAVNYHFGSREALLREVLAAAAGPMKRPDSGRWTRPRRRTPRTPRPCPRSSMRWCARWCRRRGGRTARAR